MMLPSIDRITVERIARWREPDHGGVMILHNDALGQQVLAGFKNISKKKFIPKDHPEINLRQESCAEASKPLLKIYQAIRKLLPPSEVDIRLDSSFTRYPAGPQGATFHQDFSKNVNQIITFFVGHTILYIADHRSGKNAREFPIRPGDVVIMRAPKNTSPTEKNLRPIHAIGIVPDEMYAYEIRELME